MPYRKRQSRKAPLPRAEDVLSGRVRVDAGTLIDLIARVNPTGLPLPKRESAARYARKTALQNMLIRQHADDLEAEAEPGREGIVRLRHRRLGRFACHVAIDDLDDEARSWVRMQLDLREAQAWEEAQEKSQEKKDGARREAMAGRARAVRPEAADTGGSGSAVDLPGEGEQAPAALLKQGLDALEEYDYERARACLEKAFEKSGGEGEPAAALIGFLVETMGSYDEARAAVARAEEALAAGEPRSALELLGPVDPGRLPAGLRDRVDSLLERIRSEEASRLLADHFSSCMERGDLLAARDAARALAGGAHEPVEPVLDRPCRAQPPGAPRSRDADEKERQTWRARVEEMSRLIRRQFCFRVIRGPEEPDDRFRRVDEVPYFFSDVGSTARLTADGRFLVRVDSFTGRLFMRLVDVGTSLVSAAVSLKTPRPMKRDPEVDVLVDDGSVMIADLGGLLLRLDLRTWDVEGWHRLGGLIEEGERFEEVVPVPGGRFVWISTVRGDWKLHTRVVDLREMRVCRDLGEQGSTPTLIAGPTPCLLWEKSTGGYSLMDPRGTGNEGVRLGGVGDISAASVHPGGGGFVLLVGDDDKESDGTLRVVSLDGRGAVRSIDRLEESCPDFCHALATSRSAWRPSRRMGKGCARPTKSKCREAACWSATRGPDTRPCSIAGEVRPSCFR